MIPVFIEAALRSLLVGLAVAVGLRIFRVRNVRAQKAAWGLVLVSALAMPLLLPVTAQWNLLPATVNVILPAHPMTLLEELQARIQSKSGSETKFTPPIVPIPHKDSTRTQESPSSQQGAAPAADETRSRAGGLNQAARPERNAALIAGRSASSSAQSIAHSASRVQATPWPLHIPRITVSAIILALTLYCGIAALLILRLALGLSTTMRLWGRSSPVPVEELPQDAVSLRVRASREVTSPVTLGSGILLPEDYTTWDSDKLRIVLAHERSHVCQGDFHLQLLASLYAALVWPSPLGWWLKHELAELAEAISDRAAIEEAASRTAYAQILLEFAAAPRRVSVGVAMARPGSLSRRIERLLNDNSFRQCFAGGSRALVVAALVPLALFASTMLVRVQAAADTQSPPSVPVAAPTALAASRFRGATDPAIVSESKAPASEVVAVAAPAPGIRMVPAVAMVAGGMQEGGPLSFDRTLSVSGSAQLAVSTGSGNIHFTRGAGNQIHIHGQIHINHDGSEELARQIAANPPIEQSGDQIRVGPRQDPEQWHGISVDYQIEAPAGTLLAANSGSGDIFDEGVGQNAKLQSGSGDVHANGLEGPFTVKTGSGNIVAEQSGQGDVIAETGSGDIELKDIRGGFHGQTGSGDIKASGTPSASWTLETGSGTIELWIGNAPATLDASTGSGSVTSDHGMAVQGSFDHHHIRGTLNGGGSTIRAQTGSGEIHIH
jgi:beta-lactamase regulating signal transducer with metallopeptidase domain